MEWTKQNFGSKNQLRFSHEKIDSYIKIEQVRSLKEDKN